MISGMWFVVAFIIIAVLVIIKLANEKQAVAIKVLVILFVFFTITAGYVFIKNGVNIKSSSEVMMGAKAYFAWLDKFFDNSKKVAGYATKQDWSINNTQVSKKTK
ncbi:MAG: hypothetical protein Q8Q31_03490 [Nanoarchaeota archaeon]|nr:hypothetical protein [Nanoarchaeota archaeon]